MLSHSDVQTWDPGVLDGGTNIGGLATFASSASFLRLRRKSLRIVLL